MKTLILLLAGVSIVGSAFANEEMTNGANSSSQAQAAPDGTPSDAVSDSQSASNHGKKSGHRRLKRAKRKGGSTEGNPTPDNAGETKQQAAPVGNNHL